MSSSHPEAPATAAPQSAATGSQPGGAASAAPSRFRLDPVERRNVSLLVAAQALGGASPPILLSLGGLVGQTLASNAKLATLPISLFQLGVALSTIPAAILMRQLGRRGAYVLGAMFGIVSGVGAGVSIMQSSFLLFCIATTLAGFYAACLQSYRFAATDSVPPAWRPTAISRVMVGGLVAAIIGPQVVIWTRDSMPTAPFAGSFFGQAALALLALPLLALLRPPPPTATTQSGPGRSLSVIARQPRFIVAVSAGVVSYGLMSFIMTAAPMAMVGCGHTVGEAALGIQWHVLAMFGPSFFTGRLIERFGKLQITALGLLMIAGAGAMALAGLELLNFWGSLILLGVGWNFGFIGSTAMVTDCYQPAERNKVQALNDFLVFSTVAAASFGSGHLLNTAGWETINQLMFPLVAIVVLMLGWLGWRQSAEARVAS
ncbi:MAG: MFS transporter [Burkholderiales bacterium]|nr:MFS transporter [Burkholderiales bacterium]